MRRLAGGLGIVLLAWSLAATDGYAASDDEILKRLSAIEERLSKIEKLIDVGKASDQLEALMEMFMGGKNAEKTNKTGYSKRERKEMDRLTRGRKNIKRRNPDHYLMVTKWSTGDGGKDSIGQQIVEIYFTKKNTAKKTISIVDGAVVFKDKLGETLGRLSIEKDINL